MKLRATVNRARARKSDKTLLPKNRKVQQVCKELAGLNQKPEILRRLTAERMRRLYYEAKLRRRMHLKAKLSRWIMVGPTIFHRWPNLRHSWWQKRIQQNDPEALRWLQSSRTIIDLTANDPE
jgi:hypothetical protein